MQNSTDSITTDTTMPDTGRRRRRRSAIAALALVGAIAAPAAAAAAAPSTSTPPASADDLGPRLERACLRIPNLQIRTDRLITRLQGDAETRGSLRWLESQIDTARENGREQLVVVLENRLEVRAATLDVLELRTEGLADLADRCRELGVDL